MEITLNGYYTLILAAIVLLIGHWLVYRIKWLANFNIPEPVAGGLLAALVVYLLNVMWGLSFDFNTKLQTAFMLMFFASIGLSADFARLKAGGKPLVVFLLLVSIYILIQDVVGVGMAAMLGLKPLIGLVTGSITLTGGHGTAGAWGHVLEDDYGLTAATTLGMAVATFGLVAGGLIGGPVARFLIRRQPDRKVARVDQRSSRDVMAGTPKRSSEDAPRRQRVAFDRLNETRRINAYSVIQTLAMFAGCLAIADLMAELTQDTAFELPTFIWALAGGIVIRNVLTYVFNFDMFDRAVDVMGNVSLSLFLAMALLGLKLWELAGIAGPVMLILSVQIVLMMLYATYVTYRFMGKDYDAIVLAAGHCGFGMGATPTAIANMQAITDRFGESYKAYLIVPLVGAFFVDLINAVILQGFTQIPFLQ